MHARREQLSKPAWSGDQLDSSFPPEIEDPYFDTDLNAWVLSQHRDVLAAFRSTSLSPAGSDNSKMRQETLEALTPAQLQEWRKGLVPQTEALVAKMAAGSSIDLISEYARPLCLGLAFAVTGVDPDDAQTLVEKARMVSAASADPHDLTLKARAESANTELKSYFHTGPEMLRDSTFVALSQTMPYMLGNAWFALLQYPHQWSLLHREPELIDQALEELLRFAGTVRMLSRTAAEDVDLNGSLIRKGERVILRIVAANRDPLRYPNANRVDIEREGAGHLTLGAGPHSCVGASLIRMCAVSISYPLFKRFAGASLTQPVDWQGGAVFRSPVSLWVRLHEA